MGWIWILVFWTTAGVFLYAQIGYLLLLRLISGRPRKDEEISTDSSELPSVTLIIPASNEESVIEAKLDNSLAIDYPSEQLEILVADDASSDDTLQIARRFENRGVKVLDFAERRGKAAVLNDGVRQAAGDVLCLCDANVMFRPDALKRLVSRLDDPGVGAVTGDVQLESERSTFGRGESAYYWIERRLQMAESGIGSTMGVDGGMYVVRRELFQPLPADTILDDFVVSMRVIRQGKRVALEPSAIAVENATPTARQEFRRRVRVSAGTMQALKRGEWPSPTHPVELWQFVSHRLLRWAGPVWLVILLVSNSMLWNAGLIYRVALLAQLTLYLLAIVGALAAQARETRIGGITFYFVMSHVAMAVGLIKGLLNWQQVTWKRTERTARHKPTATTSSQ